MAVAIVFEQADNFNFSFVAPTLAKNWHLSVQQIGNISSVFMIGMVVGTFIGGLCSDRFGRKKTIIGSALFFSIASLLNGLATTYTIFILCRFFTAVGIASLIIVSGPYLIEMLPSDKRGRYSGLALGIGFLGIPITALLCNAVIPKGPENWRIVYVFGAAGLIIALLGVKWLEETPRWLLSKGRIKEAEQVVEKIAGPGYKSDLSGVPIHNEKVSFKQVVSLMFGKKLIKNSFVLLVMFGLVLPTGLVFLNLASTILVDQGFTIQQGLKLTSFCSFGMLCGPFVASIVAEWGGRKIPLVLSIVGTGVFILAYGFSNNYTLMVALATIILMLSEVGVVLNTPYASELYPTKIRNAAVGLVSATGRVAGVGIMLLAPAVYAKVGFVGVYMFMGGIFLISALIVGTLGIRTSGITLEALTEETGETEEVALQSMPQKQIG